MRRVEHVDLSARRQLSGIVVNLIANTTNRGGLVVRARLDRRSSPIGEKVPAKDLRELNIERDAFPWRLEPCAQAAPASSTD